MEKESATKIFEALSSGVRLEVFRLLVRMAKEGMVAGEIATTLDIPPTNLSILIGQVATLFYFGSFFLIPFISKAEERWLIKRGLPADVENLIVSEAREKSKLPHRRRSGDIA